MTALIRNLVPLAWGYLLTWLAATGLPASVLDVIRGWEAPITLAVLAAATAAVHTAAQWMIRKPWFPNWLARIFAGSIKQPEYPGDLRRRPAAATGIAELANDREPWGPGE